MSDTQVHILQEGYSKEVVKEGQTNFIADCSVSLVTGKFRPVLIDTSGPWNKGHLVSRLHDLGFSCEDVATVVCTHGHSDHVGNLNLFPHAKIIVGFDICTGNVYESFDFKELNAKYCLNDDIFIIPTPGHTSEDVSVVVENTSIGTVVVAGDIFENEDDEFVWQSLSVNVSLQNESRHKIMKLADYIVPGHGKMFQVTENMRQLFFEDYQS